MENWYIVKDNKYYNKHEKNKYYYAKEITEILSKPFMRKFLFPHNRNATLPDICGLSFKESKKLEERITKEGKITLEEAKKRGYYFTDLILN